MSLTKPFSAIPKIPRWELLKESGLLGTARMGNISRTRADKLEMYGPITRYPISNPRIINIYDPKDICTLLRADREWPARPVIPLIDLSIKRQHLEPSISHLNGEEWFMLRQKMQKIFLQPTSATQFLDQQLRISIEFANALERVTERQTHIADFREWACRFAAESIGKILIGADMGSFSDDPMSAGTRLCSTMDKLFTLTAQGFFEPPWSQYWETRLYRKWISQHQDAKLLIAELISRYGFAFDLHHRRTGNTSLPENSNSKSDPAYDSVNNKTFFSEMLASGSLAVEDAITFAEELFIAGVESTGNALTFLVHHLSQNQEVQARLHDEIIECCNPGETLPQENLLKMKYLRACLKESMRLSPPVTGTVRITSKDLVLAGYEVPSGTVVNTMNDVVCSLGEYFYNADNFEPDRWLRQSKHTIQPFSYIPFGHGARMCIGRRFAEQEILVAIYTLVKRFRILPVSKDVKLDRVLKVFFAPDRKVEISLALRDKD